MQRLFVGIPLPQPLRAQLERLQPKPSSKVCPVSTEQMHITLHFIGEAELTGLAPPLEELRFRRFSLHLDRLGHFGDPQRGGILWAGFSALPQQLADLHACVATQLIRAGVALDGRDFVPHVTLARCKPGTNPSVFTRFQCQPQPQLASFCVDRFILFSSAQGPHGSRYTAEVVYPADQDQAAH